MKHGLWLSHCWLPVSLLLSVPHPEDSFWPAGISLIFVHGGCTFSVMVLFCFTSAILYSLPHLIQCNKYFIELYSLLLFLLDLVKAMGGWGR